VRRDFFCGLECVHSFAYVAHFVFLRDVWIRTQRADEASKQARYQLSSPSPYILATHLPKIGGEVDYKLFCIVRNIVCNVHSMEYFFYSTPDYTDVSYSFLALPIYWREGRFIIFCTICKLPFMLSGKKMLNSCNNIL
jgi:hypothetical protein